MRDTFYFMECHSVVLLVVAAAVVSCSGSPPKVNLVGQETAARERCIPIPPTPVEKVTFFDSITGNSTTEPWAQAKKDMLLNALLPNQECLSSTTQLNANGSVSFASAGITAEAGEYTSTLDYSMYRIEPVSSDPNKPSGQVHVGVSIRVKADVVTTKAGVNIGSLMAIGAAAQESSASGKMQVYVIGIDSPDVIQLFPTPTTIDQTSIQKTLEAVASIKAKIPDAVLRPHTLELCLSNADPTSTVQGAKAKLMSR
jgi:hypothetical protein